VRDQPAEQLAPSDRASVAVAAAVDVIDLEEFAVILAALGTRVAVVGQHGEPGLGEVPTRRLRLTMPARFARGQAVAYRADVALRADACGEASLTPGEGQLSLPRGVGLPTLLGLEPVVFEVLRAAAHPLHDGLVAVGTEAE